jgi:hypothetical protein
MAENNWFMLQIKARLVATRYAQFAACRTQRHSGVSSRHYVQMAVKHSQESVKNRGFSAGQPYFRQKP